MAKKRKKKSSNKLCSYAGRTLPKNRSSRAGKTLAECRWSSPGQKKKQSARMKALNRAKKLRSKMKR